MYYCMGMSCMYKKNLFHFPFDEICRRLLFFTLGRSVSAWIDYSTTKWNRQTDNIRESDRHDRRYMYVPSFALPIYKTTCHDKPYLCCCCYWWWWWCCCCCTTYCWLVLLGVSFFSFQLSCESYMWWMLLYITLRKFPGTIKVRLWEKTCEPWLQDVLLLPSLCCGAPTTDERVHAPVLYDASQIAYCRYRGRAPLPPITSNMYRGPCIDVHEYANKREHGAWEEYVSSRRSRHAFVRVQSCGERKDLGWLMVMNMSCVYH